MREVENPGSYLGLPILWGPSKQKAHAYVRNKVGKKVLGWQKRCLSFAGREVMIKVVINVIPIYSMSCFKFRTETCKEFDRMVSNFFWSNTTSASGIHWRAWQSLTRAKQEGGLGFKDFMGFNDALLAKSAWEILQNPNAMWVKILKSIYFPRSPFLQANKGSRASWGWCSILKGREFLSTNLRWQVGTCHYIEVWNAPWILENQGGRLIQREEAEINEHLLVAELIKHKQWDLSPIAEAITQDEAKKVKKIRIPVSHTEDRMIWTESKNGEYSVKKAYRMYASGKNDPSTEKPSSSYLMDKRVWAKIWKIKAIPRVRSFVWRILNRAVASSETLYRKKCANSPLCQVCETGIETLEHLLLLCPWARRSWKGCPLGISVNEYSVKSIERWLEEIVLMEGPQAEYIQAYVATHLWNIWKMRCQWIFDKVAPNPERAIELSNSAVMELHMVLDN